VCTLRSAVFEYFGLLLIEDVHIYISQLEGSTTGINFVAVYKLENFYYLGIDFGNIEDAIGEIITIVNKLVAANPGNWQHIVFQVSNQ